MCRKLSACLTSRLQLLRLSFILYFCLRSQIYGGVFDPLTFPGCLIAFSQYVFYILNFSLNKSLITQLFEHFESYSSELLHFLKHPSKKVKHHFRNLLTVADLSKGDKPSAVEVDLQEEIVHQTIVPAFKAIVCPPTSFARYSIRQ